MICPLGGMAKTLFIAAFFSQPAKSFWKLTKFNVVVDQVF